MSVSRCKIIAMLQLVFEPLGSVSAVYNDARMAARRGRARSKCGQRWQSRKVSVQRWHLMRCPAQIGAYHFRQRLHALGSMILQCSECGGIERVQVVILTKE